MRPYDEKKTERGMMVVVALTGIAAATLLWLAFAAAAHPHHECKTDECKHEHPGGPS